MFYVLNQKKKYLNTDNFWTFLLFFFLRVKLHLCLNIFYIHLTHTKKGFFFNAIK